MTNVVPASASCSTTQRRKAGNWLVCAVFACIALVLACMSLTVNAYGDNSDPSANDSNSSNSSNSGVTITDNITDTENLLGSHAAEVTDAIAQTEQETGVHVHLLYLSSFNSEQTPQQWASNVLESTDPQPNTVLLAVASNDGNLVVAVSSNSDEWLRNQDTVDKLSDAAQAPLMKSTPDWPGAATAMMDQIAQAKKTTTSRSTVMLGVAIMVGVLVVLAIVAVVMVKRRRRKSAHKSTEKKPRKNLQASIQETPRRARHSRKHE